MIIKDTSQIKTSVISLISIGKKNNLISSHEAEYYSKLSNSEPVIIFGLLCEKFYSLGATKLFKEQGSIMQTLQVCYPTFTKFIGRHTLTADKNKFGKRSSLEIYPHEGSIIVDSAYMAGIITNEERDLYFDIISWDISYLPDIELDILLLVKDWDYKKLKDKAPELLNYIKRYYPDYYNLLIEPYANEILKKVL